VRCYKQLTFSSIEYLQPRIRSARVDPGRILRFSFRPDAGAEVKNLWKTGPGSGVTFHSQQQESVWFSYMTYPKYKHCWMSVASMVAGVWTGVGFSNLKIFRTRTRIRFKNFGTGAESESENVTTATSVFQKGPQFIIVNGPKSENSPLLTPDLLTLRCSYFAFKCIEELIWYLNRITGSNQSLRAKGELLTVKVWWEPFILPCLGLETRAQTDPHSSNN